MRSIVFAVLLVVVTAQAGEGEGNRYGLPQNFSKEIPSTQYQKAWDNSFLLLFESKQTTVYATAFVVNKFSTETSTYVGFMTGHHVAQNFDSEARSFLLKDVKIRQNFFGGRKIKSLTNIPFKSVFIKSKTDQDISYVLLRLDPQQAQAMEAISFAENCELNVGDPLLTVGYPVTNFLKFYRAAQIGDDLSNTVKRWSKGIYIDNWVWDDGKKDLYGMTIDSAGGGSGGAILNIYGQVVGLMSMSDKPDYYSGSDIPGRLVPSSLTPDCEMIRLFATEGLIEGQKAVEDLEQSETGDNLRPRHEEPSRAWTPKAI